MISKTFDQTALNKTGLELNQLNAENSQQFANYTYECPTSRLFCS